MTILRLIVNALPVLAPGEDKVDVQLQLELSGPADPKSGKDIATWQWQSEVVLELGKKTMVVRKPAKATVRITLAD